MAKIRVYTKSRGYRVLKPGISLKTYQDKYPDAIKVYPPDIEELEDWVSECWAEAVDGCPVEPDGTCEHGYPSWLMVLGYI